MKSVFSIALAILAFSGTSLFAAYPTGTFRCKNANGLPDNVYTVRTLSVGGVNIPFVEASRFFRKSSAGQPVEFEEAKISGFAASSETESSTVLMIAALRLQFENDKLLGCKE